MRSSGRWIVSTKRQARGGVAALALCVGLQAVAGEPLTFSATCVMVFGYAATAQPFATGPIAADTLVRVAAALAAGVLLAAVQLAPLIHDGEPLGARRPESDVTFWSLHPLVLIETIVPHLFGDVYHADLEKLPWVRPLNTGREPLLYSLYVGDRRRRAGAVPRHGFVGGSMAEILGGWCSPFRPSHRARRAHGGVRRVAAGRAHLKRPDSGPSMLSSPSLPSRRSPRAGPTRSSRTPGESA